MWATLRDGGFLKGLRKKKEVIIGKQYFLTGVIVMVYGKKPE